MELRIDTEKDSREEIQKIIAFLQQWVDSQGSSPPSPSIPVQDDMFNLFADQPAEPEPVQKDDPTITPDFPLLNMISSIAEPQAEEPKKPKPSYRIETYD